MGISYRFICLKGLGDSRLYVSPGSIDYIADYLDDDNIKDETGICQLVLETGKEFMIYESSEVVAEKIAQYYIDQDARGF